MTDKPDPLEGLIAKHGKEASIEAWHQHDMGKCRPTCTGCTIDTRATKAMRVLAAEVRKLARNEALEEAARAARASAAAQFYVGQTYAAQVADAVNKAILALKDKEEKDAGN